MIRLNFQQLGRIPTGAKPSFCTGGRFVMPIRMLGYAAAFTGCLLGAPTIVQAMSIETALGLLLLEHPSIQAAEKTGESARFEIAKAKAGLLPSVALSAETGPQHIDNPTTRSAGDGAPYSRSKQTATLTVTQNLFDGNLTTSNIRSARLSTEASAIALEQTRQSIMFEGINSYIDTLRQKRLVDLGRETVANIQRQLNLEDERVQRGSGIAVDVLEAKSRLQIAKERLIGFEGALINAMTRYQQVYGRYPDVDAMMDPWPPIDLIPSTLDQAIAFGLRQNPAVNNSAANMELARERRETTKAELFPTLDLEGAANYEKNNDTTIGIRRDYTVLLRASWDLFTGFSTPTSLDQTVYDYRASSDNHRNTERKVIEQVRLAWQSLLTTRERVSKLENSVNIASELYASRVKLREAGKETVINVLDAQNQVTNAQINYTSTAYDVRLAAYQLLLAMGQLSSESMGLPRS